MKKLLVLFAACVFATLSLNAQTKQWLDADFKPTSTEKGAPFYQIVNKDGSYKVFQADGILRQEGKFISPTEPYMNGTINFYDEKGAYIKSREYVKGNLKPVALYTGEVKDAYTYIGMVYQYEQPALYGGANAYDSATNAGFANLVEKCRDMGADAVINLRIELSMVDGAARITIYGTAVKLK
jgi:uncharacterized protein YbjQ (UPF0145 family)